MGQENFPIEVYDPSGNSYATLPISNATVDASNDVYILGVMNEKMYAVVAGCGHISDCENSSHAWEYTFSNDTWTQLGNLPNIFDQPRSIYKLENSFIILASNGVFKYTPSRDN